MTVISNYTFPSNDDRKTLIHCVKWINEDSSPIAVMQLTHGMSEHIERYSEFASFLADKGFVVVGHDHIGHGDSVNDESERGIMHTRKPADTMIEDMYKHYTLTKESYPDLPYFILGHSMGSYLLRKMLSVKSLDLGGLNGAIIMGTGTVADAAILTGTVLCRIVGTFKGWDKPSPLINSILFGSEYKDFDLSGKDLSNTWLSKNVENIREYFDPENKKDGFAFSLNGYMVLFDTTWYDNRPSNIKLINRDLPVIFVSGDNDPVGSMGKGVKKACEKFKEAGIKDVTVKLYEGDRHEVLNELDRSTVYNDLFNWMSERM